MVWRLCGVGPLFCALILNTALHIFSVSFHVVAPCKNAFSTLSLYFDVCVGGDVVCE